MEREQEIRLIAYYLWEREGCPDGRAVEHWVEAETMWHDSQDTDSREMEAATEDTQPIEPRAVAEETQPQQSAQPAEKRPATKRAAKTAKKAESKGTSRRRTPEKTIS
jgi:Protein of unknown function (DUF2934)